MLAHLRLAVRLCNARRSPHRNGASLRIFQKRLAQRVDISVVKVTIKTGHHDEQGQSAAVGQRGGIVLVQQGGARPYIDRSVSKVVYNERTVIDGGDDLA